MSWNLKRVDNVVVVTMNSNPVNKQNPDFFRDLNEAFDIIDEKHEGQPVVLTGEGKTFSAGIDFEYSFSLFERGDKDEITEWYMDFRDAMLRVFQHPSLTVAALNGHAFAGGLILALGCDVRIAAPQATRFALNEVPIGIPMPMAYNELIRFRVGVKTATEAILTGKEYDLDEACECGFVNSVAAEGELLSTAIARARLQRKETVRVYAHTKELLQRPVIETIKRLADDAETIAVISSPEALLAQKAALKALKMRSPNKK